MAPPCLNCSLILDQEDPEIAIGVSENIGNYKKKGLELTKTTTSIFKCTMDIRKALKMGAPKVRETLLILCENTVGLDEEVKKVLKELYRSVIVPNSEWGTLYRRKRDERGNWVLDTTLWAELGGVRFPIITLPDAVSYILGATLDLKEGEGVEGGTITAVSIIFAAWIERLSPAAYPTRVGACWIQGSCFLFNPKDASHAFGSTLPSQRDERKRQSEFRFYAETKKIRKEWLDALYQLPASAPVMQQRSLQALGAQNEADASEPGVPRLGKEQKETETEINQKKVHWQEETMRKRDEEWPRTTRKVGEETRVMEKELEIQKPTNKDTARFAKSKKMSVQDFLNLK